MIASFQTAHGRGLAALGQAHPLGQALIDERLTHLPAPMAQAEAVRITDRNTAPHKRWHTLAAEIDSRLLQQADWPATAALLLSRPQPRPRPAHHGPKPSPRTPRSAGYQPRTSATDSSPNSTSPSTNPRHEHRSHPPRATRRRPHPPDQPHTDTHAQTLSQAVRNDELNSPHMRDACHPPYLVEAPPVLQITSPQRD